MHPWYIFRAYHQFWSWLTCDYIGLTGLQKFHRIVVASLLFLFLPLTFMFLCGFCSGDEERLYCGKLFVAQPYYLALFLIYRAAESPRFMPRQLRAISLNVRALQKRLAIPSTVRSAFEKDLIERTHVYLRACRQASAREIALTAICDISKKLDQKDSYEKAFVKLKSL